VKYLFTLLLCFVLNTTGLHDINKTVFELNKVLPIEKQEIEETLTTISDTNFEQQRTRTGCYSTCNKILNKTGFKDSKTKYQVVKESGRNIINLDTDYSKIDRQLREGIPVLVGVHHTFKYGYNEGTTDHFVIIIEKGYDENGLY